MMKVHVKHVIRVFSMSIFNRNTREKSKYLNTEYITNKITQEQKITKNLIVQHRLMHFKFQMK
jgi:hypothetical protein